MLSIAYKIGDEPAKRRKFIDDLGERINQVLTDFDQSIQSFTQIYVSSANFFVDIDFNALKTCLFRIEYLIHDYGRLDQMAQLIINRNVPEFISEFLKGYIQQGDYASAQPLITLTNQILMFDDTTITMKLYNGFVIAFLSNLINSPPNSMVFSLDDDFVKSLFGNAIDSIGYANVNLLRAKEMNGDRLFFNIPQITSILEKYPDLYVNIMNLVYNSMICNDNMTKVEDLLRFFLSNYTIEKIFNDDRFDFIQLFPFLIFCIKHKKDFPFHVLQETRFLSNVIFNIITSSEIKQFTLLKSQDICFYSLKFIIACFVEHEELIKEMYLQPCNLYNIIADTSSSNNDVSASIQLLQIMISLNGDYVHDLLVASQFKTGRGNILNYQQYFEFPYKIKKWYIRLLSQIIKFGRDFDEIKELFNPEFADSLLSYLDPNSPKLSKSILMTLTALVDRSIIEKSFDILEVLGSEETNSFLENFNDEAVNEETQQLTCSLIESISQASYAFQQK